MKPSLILDRCVRAEFHTLLLISVFLLLAGHNQPGGGFVGELVAGAALALRLLVGGVGEVHQAIRLYPLPIVGGGLLLSGATALAPLVAGGQLLESAKATLSLPLLGMVPVSSTLAFDVGVYLVVVGLVLLLLRSLGGEGGGDDAEGDEG